MIVYNCEQRSEEWRQLRIGTMTASACEEILSPTRRKSFVNKLIAEITTGESAPFEANQFMQWGIDNEDEARRFYEQHKALKVEQIGFVYKDEDKYVGCSPDGLVGEVGLIEIKCPMSKTHIGYLRDSEGKQNQYFYQMQFQMYVTDRRWCDFMSYDPRLPEPIRAHIVRIPRSEDAILKIHSSVQCVVREINSFLKDHDLTWKR